MHPKSPLHLKLCSSKIILILLFFVISCANDSIRYPKFNYRKWTKEPSTIKSKKRIAIKTFEDGRKIEDISYSGLELLPLIPYANSYFNRPETSFKKKSIFFPEVDLAKGLETELSSYNFFEKVFYTDRNSPKNADYIIFANIKENQIKSRETVFGISNLVFASQYHLYGWPYFWNIIKTDFFTVTIEIQVEIKDLKTNQIILKNTFIKKESDWEVLINKDKASIWNYLYLNEKIIREISKSTIQHFEENPK